MENPHAIHWFLYVFVITFAIQVAIWGHCALYTPWRVIISGRRSTGGWQEAEERPGLLDDFGKTPDLSENGGKVMGQLWDIAKHRTWIFGRFWPKKG